MRGQVSLDFIVNLSLALFMLALVTVIYLGESEASAVSQERVEARHAAHEIASLIDAAVLAGDGTVITAELGNEYDISLEYRSLVVRFRRASGSAPLLTDRVANASPLESVYNLTVRNVGGTVYVG